MLVSWHHRDTLQVQSEIMFIYCKKAQAWHREAVNNTDINCNTKNQKPGQRQELEGTRSCSKYFFLAQTFMTGDRSHIHLLLQKGNNWGQLVHRNHLIIHISQQNRECRIQNVECRMQNAE